MKKVMLILMLITLCVNLGYSVEYLNSCGKNSGWVNGETYILDFTEIPSFYGSDVCFEFNSISELEGITFEGTGLINNSKIGLILFKFTQGKHTNFNFENIEIDSVDYFLQFAANTDNPSMLLDSVINNINIGQIQKYFIFLGISSTASTYINNSYFNNVFVDSFGANPSVPIYARQSGGRSNFNYNLIENSYFGIGNRGNFFDCRFTIVDSCVISPNINYNEFRNVVTSLTNIDALNPSVVGSTYFNSSIVKNKLITTHGETINAKYVNMALDVVINDYQFIQDIQNSRNRVIANKIVIPVHNDIIGSPNTLQLQSLSVLDSSLATLTFTQSDGIRLTPSTSLDCSHKNLNKCFFNNTPQSLTPINNYFVGYVYVTGNNVINNTEFDIKGLEFEGLGSSIISNLFDVTYSNIKITNNLFKSEGNILLDSSFESQARPFIKLRANNIDINNNEFRFSNSNNLVSGHFIAIQGNNPATNRVTLNEFYNDVVNPNVETSIFEHKAQTNFYNNFVGENVVISHNPLSNLDVSVYTGFLHTDGSVYYYTLGNYYEDNTGCVDSNNDGFCDSPYTSGVVTDDKPLVSYPFDFTQYLLTADNVVNSLDFNISLNIEDNQTFSIEGSNSILTFSFSHNSDFEDLFCDFVIDGSLIENEGILFPEKNTEYSITLTGWVEKDYNYRIECYNPFTYKISDEVGFTILFQTENGNGDGNGGTIMPPLVSGDFLGDLFSSDISKSGNAVSGLFQALGTPMVWLLFAGIFLIGFAVLSVFFGMLWWMIGGKR